MRFESGEAFEVNEVDLTRANQIHQGLMEIREYRMVFVSTCQHFKLSGAFSSPE